MTITEFLLARIAEDRAKVEHAPDATEDTASARGPGWYHGLECTLCGHVGFDGTESNVEDAWHEHMEAVHQRSRVLAECEAKRRIVDLAEQLDEPTTLRDRLAFPTARVVLDHTLQALASVYTDHPDFDPAWR